MIILASSSPRREKLLKDAGIKFVTIPSEVDEDINLDLEPKEIARSLAMLKAKHVSSSHVNDIVIGADTIVVYDDQILGKPKNEDEAFTMLSMLSDKCHMVYTGVAFVKGDKEESFVSEASVWMRKLSELEIKAYIHTKEPMDKAGAYGIQGEGGNLIDHYQGDFFTIMGLPLKEVLKMLEKFE